MSGRRRKRPSVAEMQLRLMRDKPGRLLTAEEAHRRMLAALGGPEASVAPGAAAGEDGRDG